MSGGTFLVRGDGASPAPRGSMGRKGRAPAWFPVLDIAATHVFSLQNMIWLTCSTHSPSPSVDLGSARRVPFPKGGPEERPEGLTCDVGPRWAPAGLHRSP